MNYCSTSFVCLNLHCARSSVSRRRPCYSINLVLLTAVTCAIVRRRCDYFSKLALTTYTQTYLFTYWRTELAEERSSVIDHVRTKRGHCQCHWCIDRHIRICLMQSLRKLIRSRHASQLRPQRLFLSLAYSKLKAGEISPRYRFGSFFPCRVPYSVFINRVSRCL